MVFPGHLHCHPSHEDLWHRLVAQPLLGNGQIRLYDGDASAAWTLHRIVRDFLAAFSPVCPFFTHHISSTVYGKSAVETDAFPQPPLPEVAKASTEGERLCSLSGALQEFNGHVWGLKKEAGISLNQPIEGVEIPSQLVEFSETRQDAPVKLIIPLHQTRSTASKAEFPTASNETRSTVHGFAAQCWLQKGYVLAV